MADTHEQSQSTTSSQGHILSGGTYLDSHYAADGAAYEAMVHFAGFQPGWAILDAGAGGGSYLPLLAQLLMAQGTIEAIDLAPENVQMIQARAQRGEFACPVTAQVGGITALPYADASFDAVWCANVFQYLTDAEVAKALAEFKRLVRPGGLMVVKDADLAAHPLGIPPIISGQIVEYACAHADPNIAAYFQHLLRIPQLPQFYRTAELEVLAYKTFQSEWRHPVHATDRPYLETAVPGWGNFALSLLKVRKYWLS